jgi:tetratricopeptide (TPR) repeat protein
MLSVAFAITIPSSAQDRPPVENAELAAKQFQDGLHEDALASINKAIQDKKETDVSFLVVRCRILQALQRDEEAAKDVQSALATRPNYVPARMERAKLALKLNLFAEVEQECEFLFENGEKPFEIRGHARFQLKNFVGALEDFSSLIEERSDLENETRTLAHAYWVRARAFEELRIFDLALTQFDKSLELYPENSTQRFRARCSVELKRFEEAIADYTKYLETEPELVPYDFLERCFCYLEVGDLAGARADYKKATELAGDNTETPIFQKAKQRIEELQTLFATGEEFQPVQQKQFPPNKKYIEFLVQVLTLENQPEKMDQLVANTLASPPANADDAEIHAWIYNGQQKYEEALKALQIGIGIEPENVNLLKARILTYSTMVGAELIETRTAFDKTNDDVNKLIELQHPYGYQHRAGFFHATKELDKAMGAYTAAIQTTSKKASEKTFGELTFYRAKTLFDAKIYDVALSEFEKAVALGYDEPGSRVSMGILHAGQDQHDKVIEDFTFEINKLNNNPFYQIYRGWSYEALGKTDMATQDYKEAFAAADDNSQIQTIAKNSLNEVQPKRECKSLLTLLQNQDVEAFKQNMNPALASMVDDQKLANRLAIINHHRQLLALAEWSDFQSDSDLGNQKVTIQFLDSDDQVTIFRDDKGKLLGFSFRQGEFKIDTMDVIADSREFPKRAATLWQSFYAKDFKKAYKILTSEHPEAVRNFPYETFEKMAKAMEQSITEQGLTLQKISQLQTRIMEPQPEKRQPAVECFHLMALDQDKFNSGRVIFEYQAEIETFLVTNYQSGDNGGAYPHRNFELEEKFLKAMVSCKPDEVVQLLHPGDQDIVVPGILIAFQKDLLEKYGQFESLSLNETFAFSQVTEAIENNYCQGVANFEKGTLPFNVKSSFGTIDSFNFDGENFTWREELKDLTVIEERGSAFLLKLATEDPQNCAKWLPDGFDPLDPVEIAEFQKTISDSLGTIESIDVTQKTYEPDEEVWRIDYIVNGSKSSTPGLVKFEISVWNASMYEFNLEPPTTEDETKESDSAASEIEESDKGPDKC